VSEGMKKGELHVIQNLSGATATFSEHVWDNYDISSETVTITKLIKTHSKISDLKIKYLTPADVVGMVVKNDVNGRFCNVSTEGAQRAGVAFDYCFGTYDDDGYRKGCNNNSIGYGAQFNNCYSVRLNGVDTVNCRRGGDFSGIEIPTRNSLMCLNAADGGGLDYVGGDLKSVSSGFGGHESSENNLYIENRISNVKSGIICRGVNEGVSGNRFYGDINNQCVLIQRGMNTTVTNNTYNSNLRPAKTLDVVSSDDDDQKCPWFVKIVNPPYQAGFYDIQDNTAQDLKNAFLALEILPVAPVTTLKNLTVQNNSFTVNGSTASTNTYLIDKTDQDLTIEDSSFIDNRAYGGLATFAPVDSGITIDLDSVEIDNYVLPSSHLTETTNGGANLTVNKFFIMLTLKNGVVRLTGIAAFDIATATSVVKLQNLPTKALNGGTYGPPNAWLTHRDVTTSSAGTQCLISSPEGVTADLLKSIWLSADAAAYNTGFPVGVNHAVPIDISYMTEMRGYRVFN